MAFDIVGSDIYLPETKWSDKDFDLYLGLKKGTSKRQFGVETRHVAANHETAIYMAAKAALGALKNASLTINDIDLLVYASASHHQALPYDAAAVLASLNAPVNLASLDINSSCLSFLTALDYAQCIFLAKRHQRILIVSSELVTGITLNKTTPAKTEVATLFSDGAAAYVLQAAPNVSGFTGALFETHHQGYNFCQVKAGGSHVNPHHTAPEQLLAASQFEMDGKALFRHMTTTLPAFLVRGLQQSNIQRDQIDYLLPHQASHLALKRLPKMSGFCSQKIVNNVAQCGNQIAASLPINLHLLRQQQANSGKKVLLIGSAAGLSLGMGFLTL
ncbi:3-oxoacyl-[acyl-carrier-protein] synthase III C-terminal domain-containing protein [Motilimonas sp. E26]|uniref:3-oxoacyl-[acyl-carrier-protein] synthase III C-terminal domain-containing protein n=1 Tax=Motilimonas sp. E26 TaxID=2865674 RepID=UPI001E5708D3|nr:3-oxoacyl-[acyl-carrier-protein] synthase III C-terminal domain-containing protein [Motilimonas sp. E26]MCE0556097.1 hypothetical protein [Motilimonas sp. E26]